MDNAMVPNVSVIIAAHNVEKYIERAVRSALDQQGVAVEVIVVNDASTDNTMAVVSKIDDTRVKLLNLPKNSGPSIARNTGIAIATAPWFAILDGDDAFLPGRLARCLMRAKTLAADIVVDNLEVYKEADGTRKPMFEPDKFSRLSTLSLARFIDGNIFYSRTGSLGYLKPIFSTDFIKRNHISYDPELFIGEDYIFLSEALANGALCAVESSTGYLYTVRKGSISHRLSLENIVRIMKGDKRFIEKYPLRQVEITAHRKREASLKEAYIFTKLVDALKQRNVKAAWEAFRSNPSAVRHLSEAALARLKRPFQRKRA